jgi:dipeptidyl aminopeptidase/acylaminoacyl peptidase
MKRVMLFAALAALAAPLAAQQPAATQPRRPLDVRTFLALEKPAEPAVSPDGRWVVYTVVTTDVNANRRRQDLWLQAFDSAAGRKISADSLGGRSAKWSPDGRQIAYVNSRGGTPQVWIYDVATRRHAKLTSLSTGADGVLWSPSGRTLLFVSEVYPSCADDACNRRQAAADEARPSRARIIDNLLYRHWNVWEDGLKSHLFVVPAAGGTPRDLLGGWPWDTPVPPFSGSESYAWSPDEREVAFTTKIGPDQAWTTNNDVYTVPVAGGAPVNQTAGMLGAEGTPSYSPDGRYLAFLSQQRAGFESDRPRLMVKDRQSGQVREVTHDWDSWIAEYAWLPASDAFVAVSEVRQRNQLLHIVLASGDVHQVLTDMDPGQVTAAVTPAHLTMAFVSDALNRPAEVYTWVVDHQNPRPPRQLTHLTDATVAQLAMNPAREFGWVGAGGDSCHGLLLMPPNFDPSRKYPVVILIHGGPQGAWTDEFHGRWNGAMFAAPGYVVAMLNPRGSTGFGQRFVDQVSRDWGGRVYEDLMRGVDVVAALPYVDSARMGAAGASFGSYMVNWINGHTDRFKVLVSHDGDFDLVSSYGGTEELWFPEWDLGGPPWENGTLYERWSPSTFAYRWHTPTLVIHGALDYRIPDSEGMQTFTALQRQGIPSRFLWFPDEGHWVGKPQNQIVWWNTVQEWLGRYLHP